MTAAPLDLRGAIARVAGGEHLSADEMAAVFGEIMAGGATPAQIGGLLIGLRANGETADELAGAARAMRAHATPLPVPDPDRAVDTCGTGGDGSGAVNVSTLAALVAAGAGATVAKHGNRALSSRAGSADVLEALGVRADAAPAVVARCVAEAGIGFAFAPVFHAATRHAAGPRRELGTRTVFNLLGPLTNPAAVRRQVVGVFAPRWCAPMAAALGALGARRAVVLHGDGWPGGPAGLDEVSVTGATHLVEWVDGATRGWSVTPAAFGLEACDPAGLAGGDAAFNAGVLRRVLAGEGAEPGHPLRAVVVAAVMEAALALYVLDDAAGPAELPALAARAAAALRDGAAAAALARWAALSHAPEVAP